MGMSIKDENNSINFTHYPFSAFTFGLTGQWQLFLWWQMTGLSLNSGVFGSFTLELKNEKCKLTLKAFKISAFTRIYGECIIPICIYANFMNLLHFLNQQQDVCITPHCMLHKLLAQTQLLTPHCPLSGADHCSWVIERWDLRGRCELPITALLLLLLQWYTIFPGRIILAVHTIGLI